MIDGEDADVLAVRRLSSMPLRTPLDADIIPRDDAAAKIGLVPVNDEVAPIEELVSSPRHTLLVVDLIVIQRVQQEPI